MFPKTHRLAKAKDISLVYERGRSFFNPIFVVKFLPTKASNGFSRFTVVVSTKVSKKAVIRNKIKRVIRAFLQSKKSLMPVGDYIITVRGGIVNKSNNEIRNELSVLLNNKKLI